MNQPTPKEAREALRLCEFRMFGTDFAGRCDYECEECGGGLQSHTVTCPIAVLAAMIQAYENALDKKPGQ